MLTPLLIVAALLALAVIFDENAPRGRSRGLGYATPEEAEAARERERV